MENEKEGRKCVVKDKIYDFYYKGCGKYVHYPSQAILNYTDIPEEIKNDSRLEIIPLDSRKGLELLAEEEKDLPKV